MNLPIYISTPPLYSGRSWKVYKRAKEGNHCKCVCCVSWFHSSPSSPTLDINPRIALSLNVLIWCPRIVCQVTTKVSIMRSLYPRIIPGIPTSPRHAPICITASLSPTSPRVCCCVSICLCIPWCLSHPRPPAYDLPAFTYRYSLNTERKVTQTLAKRKKVSTLNCCVYHYVYIYIYTYQTAHLTLPNNTPHSLTNISWTMPKRMRREVAL